MVPCAQWSKYIFIIYIYVLVGHYEMAAHFCSFLSTPPQQSSLSGVTLSPFPISHFPSLPLSVYLSPSRPPSLSLSVRLSSRHPLETSVHLSSHSFSIPTLVSSATPAEPYLSFHSVLSCWARVNAKRGAAETQAAETQGRDANRDGWGGGSRLMGVGVAC